MSSATSRPPGRIKRCKWLITSENKLFFFKLRGYCCLVQKWQKASDKSYMLLRSPWQDKNICNRSRPKQVAVLLRQKGPPLHAERMRGHSLAEMEHDESVKSVMPCKCSFLSVTVIDFTLPVSSFTVQIQKHRCITKNPNTFFHPRYWGWLTNHDSV